MFNYNIKDQVLLLNHKTFGLENELKDLEEKIRIGQNRLHGIQRQLRRELLQGEEGFPIWRILLLQHFTEFLYLKKSLMVSLMRRNYLKE